MQLDEGDLTADVQGQVAVDAKVLVIRRIEVTYQLRIAAGYRETAERVHARHAEFCPVARTLSDCVEISTELRINETPA